MRYCIVFALLAAAPVVTAAELDHDFVEAGYLQGETGDLLGLDLDVTEIRGVKALGDWQLLGGYRLFDRAPAHLTFEGMRISSDIKISYLNFGGGYVFSLGRYFAIPFSAGLVRASTDASTVSELPDESGDGTSVIRTNDSESDTGYFVDLGLRVRPLESLEIEFEHRFMNVSSTRLNDQRLDVRYALTPAIAVGLAYGDFEGDTVSGATIRWRF